MKLVSILSQFIYRRVLNKIYGKQTNYLQKFEFKYVNIENEKYKAVAYIQMIPVLLESIKQLNKKVEDLQNNNDNSCEL